MYQITLLTLVVTFPLSQCGFKDALSSVRGNVYVQRKAAINAISRVLGQQKADLFELYVTNRNEAVAFTIIKKSGDVKVSITASSGVLAVWGVNYYLKNYCNCHVSWDGDQINIPPELPEVNVTVTSYDKLLYYQNVCTSSYSFVWWDWERWEREIDWMAFNGINVALAFTGQEAIWKRTYDALGLEYSDFTGPGFLAWNRMGNLRNYSSGLTNNWLQQQLALQHKILNHLRDLGIIPVLPGFCGIVPRSFEKAYPTAKLTKMAKWNRFSDEYCCPYLLDPNDALFPVITHIFMREYIYEFGTNHIYNCDVFNENTPASGDLQYLSNMSSTIYRAMTSFDPDAVWLLQGWMFTDPFWAVNSRVKAFVTAVPTGKMLILDLQSDLTPQFKRLKSYFGQPFIWCTLHNFGGQLGMYGHLSRLNMEIPKGRKFKNSTMVGIGIAPEGIDQNYIIYEFTLDSAFRADSINLTNWVSMYAMRRYGTTNGIIDQAWQLLKNTVYNYRPESAFRLSGTGLKPIKLPMGEHISKNILVKMPSLHLNEPTWYNRSVIFDVYQKFLSACEDNKISSSALFQHDLIDITRQTVQTAISTLYFKIIKLYALNEVETFQKNANVFLNLLLDLDIVLASGRKFLLGTWLERAKRLSCNRNESFQYEYNARNQITLWGPNGEIRDYAAKQWAGMVADYYRPRWEIFMRSLNASLVDSVPFNATRTKEDIFRKVEKPFGLDRKVYRTSPTGHPMQVVKKFNEKWESKLFEIFNDETLNYYVISS